MTEYLNTIQFLINDQNNDYSKDFLSTSHYAAIDTKRKIIYICNEQSKLLKIDLKTKSIETISHEAHFGTFPAMVFADDRIHIISNYLCKHCVFDTSSNKFEELWDFSDKEKLPSTEPLFIKQHNSMIMTTYNGNNKTSPVSVMEFKNNKWTDLNVKNCEYLYDSNMITTTTGDFIIFLGGTDVEKVEDHRLIFIYDIKHEKLMKCGIEAPSDSICSALTRNKSNEELLTFGFVHDCYKVTNFRGIQMIPFYLIKVIGKWVCYETIHLVGDEGHWTIDMDKIITNSSYIQ